MRHIGSTIVAKLAILAILIDAGAARCEPVTFGRGDEPGVEIL
jgi:hypothetical protein